jgi:hypothetical protein
MFDNVNMKDLELLNDPHQLILENQKLIDKIIFMFISSGNFKYEEHDEIKQQVNEELLNKIPKIKSQFLGKASLNTYLSVIIRNICKELLRKRVHLKYISLEEVCLKSPTSEALNFLVVEEEIIRLQNALELYYKQKSKLILCLKLKFKIPFDYSDFTNVNHEISWIDFNFLVRQVYPYQECPDIKIFSALTTIINKYDGKNNTPDALRKWIKSKINELIEILNGDPPTYHYTEETLQILFEKCFCKQVEMTTKVY